MSEFFTGITFTQQKVTPSDDAAIRNAVLSDGTLYGCSLSYAGSTLTMGPGLLVARGRQFRHTSVQNWAVTGANSGYARLVLAIDLTRASTKDSFDQVTDFVEYATAPDGFAPLRQDDINEAGTVYQFVACVVSLGAGGITGIVSRMGAAGALTVRANLAAGAWQPDENSGYVQTVTIDGLTDSKLAKAYPAWSGNLSEKIAVKEEASKVSACTRSGNAMTFECWEEQPARDIPIMVEVYT